MLRRLWPADASADGRGVRVWPICLRLAVGAAVVAFVLPLCRRALIVSDEGYLLQQAVDLLDGRLLYRDMDAFVTPGIWLALAGLFAVVEPSVLASRSIVLASYLTTAWLVWRIVAREGDERAALWAMVAYGVATVWAFPAWTITFYSPVAMTFGLWALERLLAWRIHRRPRDAVWCGVLLGLSITFKQNYGALASLGVMAGLVLVRWADGDPLGGSRTRAADAAWRVMAGAAAVGAPILAGFAAAGALPAVIDSLVVHPFQFASQHDIPYLSPRALFADPEFDLSERFTYGAYAFNQIHPPFAWLEEAEVLERMHVLLYWLPPLVFAASAWLVTRPRDAGARADTALGVVWCVCGGLFLGVFPRADFNHLVHVYQPVLVVLVLTIHRLGGRLRAARPEWRLPAAGLGILAACAYTLVAAYWYVALLGIMRFSVDGERGGVLLAGYDAFTINHLLSEVEQSSSPDDALLTVPDLSMLNFLSGRAVPSSYYNMYQHHIHDDGGAAVAAESERARVPLAITRFDDFFAERVGLREYAPVLAEYLRSHFVPLLAVGTASYVVHRRRARPLPVPLPPDILDGCDVVAAGAAVRHHLLWSTLYHLSEDLHGDREEAETACRVRVPAAGADLVVRIGHLEPGAVQRSATFQSDILVRADGSARRLHRMSMRLLPSPLGQLSFPIPEEQRIDLSPWAGDEVTLIFRSVRRGAAGINPYDTRGVGLYWQDPVIAPR